MVKTSSEINTTPCTRLRLKNELSSSRRSLRYKSTDEIPNECDSHINSSKKKTPQSTKKVKNENDEDNRNVVNSKLCGIKLKIKRIDELNYVSTSSPNTLKMTNTKLQDNKLHKMPCLPITPKKNSRKSLRWSERYDDDVKNLVEAIIDGDITDTEDELNEDELNMPKRQSQRISSSFYRKSNGMSNILSTKRLRKSVDRFGDVIDLNEIEIPESPERKRMGQPVDEHINTPKRSKKGRKTSIIEKDENADFNIDDSRTPINKKSRKSHRWSERNDNDLLNLFEEPMTDDDDDDDDDELLNMPKNCSRRVSSSSSRKSNGMTNTSPSALIKRPRKPVDRFGDIVDLNEITPDSSEKKPRRQSVDAYLNTPKSNKKGRKISINDEDKNAGIDIETWRTPKKKHLRQSVTPRSGSKARRSILQDIPENKEIEISTPKTPRKTPKTHVKNLTASVSKRLDSGARVPCSPLEKARANLHLHAAPKHLPCREFEYKSIHSFLVRKINDELTGSMYISGVPGTGKTATVKRVIDSLNADLLMKHSFKFVEINGLRLANPHQAFSVIWKELMGETVSSSRAQTLLNDYFSNKKVKELSTILLVDEVDHICNRKQDVVYNILDWPSQTGSKVVVITIANTMDLPERVLRGCVTSRMGLTRLVFKPYTFQQLQEIIMNRLIGNSTFDPDAVQLVARKVAAISGDARRALDICRRAIDLIKPEDDSQLITIKHVDQVLNSILSGVRVTAIRCCCILEQYFLRALSDLTSSTGIEHSTIDSVYTQLKSICLLEGEELPNEQQVLIIAYRLRDSGLIFLEKKRWDIFRKVSLNVSPEDISYALDKYND
ncbi:origin recognition complex subunit 1-like isoform X3 [Aphis gossypii]|uniref:origin recognition complex subunit 1-like isoform X3 n=1 Tax=Aphis gossypii TaxID=80765 RepID=UPI0021594208|nr:origin recognition complex subunit 1-like isoform X3 [Aphis gossypii]